VWCQLFISAFFENWVQQRPFLVTGGTATPLTAGKSDKKLCSAIRTANPGKSLLQITAFEELVDEIVYYRSSITILLLESLRIIDRDFDLLIGILIFRTSHKKVEKSTFISLQNQDINIRLRHFFRQHGVFKLQFILFICKLIHSRSKSQLKSTKLTHKDVPIRWRYQKTSRSLKISEINEEFSNTDTIKKLIIQRGFLDHSEFFVGWWTLHGLFPHAAVPQYFFYYNRLPKSILLLESLRKDLLELVKVISHQGKEWRCLRIAGTVHLAGTCVHARYSLKS
jgi:hypothetical protein